MKQLATEFRKNDLFYRIVKRSDTRYIAKLFSQESGNCIGIETGRIKRQKAQTRTISGKVVQFEEMEVIPGNEAFGKDPYKCEACMRADQTEKIEALFRLGTEKDRLGKQGKEKVIPTIHPKILPFAQSLKIPQH
ncbi:MAG: hypothetical protein PHI28_04355 [Mangrovibacterium sp.]|nr:hypothetical protein [Mangrovibacterium sp.]